MMRSGALLHCHHSLHASSLLTLSMLMVFSCISEEEPPEILPPPPAPTAPESEFNCDIPSLFEVKCGGSICHSAGISTAAELDLTSPGVEARLVGKPGKSCAGILAEPADPEGSLLYTKVLDAPSCGARMPLSSDPLSADERACLRDWISGLLPDTEPEPEDTCPDCECEPDAVELCYAGPPGTADVGICKSGTRICEPDGSGWSECEGEVLPVGENCLTADIDENCDGKTPACSELWSIAFGDERTQVMRSVAVDSKKNIYSAGDFEGAVSFGAEALVSGEKSNIVIAKHDRYGNPVWSKHFGDSSNQFAAKLVVDAKDNIVVVGRVYGHTNFGGGPLAAKGSGDVIVAKLDSNGKHLWSKVFGGKDPERAERVAIANDGDVILTGTFTSNMSFGGEFFFNKGKRDAFVVRLDGDTGEHVFSRQIGGSGDDYGFGVDVEKDGDIIIAGRFEKSIELGSTLTSEGGSDIYVAALSSTNKVKWKKRFGGAGDEKVHDLVVSPTTGDIVLLGAMSGTVNFGAGKLVSKGSRDIFILGLSANGTPRYSANYGDAKDQFGVGNEENTWMTLAAGDDGVIYFGGLLVGDLDLGWFELESLAGSTDMFYVALDEDGAPLWGYRYGSPDADFALDFAVSGNSHMVLAGRTFGKSIDFGPAGEIESRGGSDALLVKVPL